MLRARRQSQTVPHRIAQLNLNLRPHHLLIHRFPLHKACRSPAVMAFITSLPISSRCSFSTSSPRSATRPLPSASPCNRIQRNLKFTIHAGKDDRTFVAVKPDGMNRALLGNIISRFETKGYTLVGIKTLIPTRQIAEDHYAALKGKPFYPGLVDFITSGPLCAMVWQGENVVAAARKLIGETDPLNSPPGTIRGDFGVDVGRKYVLTHSLLSPPVVIQTQICSTLFLRLVLTR